MLPDHLEMTPPIPDAIWLKHLTQDKINQMILIFIFQTALQRTTIGLYDLKM